jgi:hypothetical protein
VTNGENLRPLRRSRRDGGRREAKRALPHVSRATRKILTSDIPDTSPGSLVASPSAPGAAGADRQERRSIGQEPQRLAAGRRPQLLAQHRIIGSPRD